MLESFQTLHGMDVVIGIGLGLLSSIFGEGANMLLKKYTARQLANSKLHWFDSFVVIYAVCALFSIGSGIYALEFLSLSIYNCGTALNIPLVALMSWYFLNEKINRYQSFCIILLAASIVVVALTGDRTKPKNMMQTLGNNMNVSIYPVMFLSIIGALEVIAAFFLFKRYTLITKLNKDAEFQRSTQIVNDQQPGADETEEYGTVLPSPASYEKIITNIPGETYVGRVISIFGFSCLCAMQLFWMVISADILLNQITLYFARKPVVILGWVFLPVGVFCGGLFFCCMNMNLACFRAIDVLPIYVAFQNVTDGIGSMAMLGSTPYQPSVYVLALAFAFTFGLLYTALIDEKEFFAYAVYILPFCFKKEKDRVSVIERFAAASIEKCDDADLVIKSKPIELQMVQESLDPLFIQNGVFD